MRELREYTDDEQRRILREADEARIGMLATMESAGGMWADTAREMRALGLGERFSTPERMMSDEIRPALSAEEWAEWERLRGDRPLHAVLRLFELDEADEVADAARNYMALANAALPDGHPGKITHADVAVLDQLTTDVTDGGEPPRYYVCTWVDAETMGRLHALAAKLAALLPPEG